MTEFKNRFSTLSTKKPSVSGLYDLSPRFESVTLSLQARAVHTHYLNKPDGWNLNRHEVKQALRIGDHVLRKALKELEQSFLVISERVREKGSKQFVGFIYHRFASPEEGREWAKENSRIDNTGMVIPAVKTAGVQHKPKQAEQATDPVVTPAVDFPPVENRSTKKEINKKSFVCVAGEASPGPTQSVDDFIGHFAYDLELDPDGTVFGLMILRELITGYFEHCKARGKNPNLTGCRYRLEHQKRFREQAEAKQRAAERLAAERLARVNLEADKLETLNDLWHMDNLNRMKESGLLISPEYLHTQQGAPHESADIWQGVELCA